MKGNPFGREETLRKANQCLSAGFGTKVVWRLQVDAINPDRENQDRVSIYFKSRSHPYSEDVFLRLLLRIQATGLIPTRQFPYTEVEFCTKGDTVKSSRSQEFSIPKAVFLAKLTKGDFVTVSALIDHITLEYRALDGQIPIIESRVILTGVTVEP